MKLCLMIVNDYTIIKTRAILPTTSCGEVKMTTRMRKHTKDCPHTTSFKRHVVNAKYYKIYK